MKLGICANVTDGPAAKAAGFEYVEPSVQGLLEGLVADEQWQGLSRAKAAGLPCPSANMLVPAALKVTGPSADATQLRAYMQKVLERAEKVGMKALVFGSGGARQVPDGFDHTRATDQIVEFGKMLAPIAQKHGVTVVVEPLNRKECNIVNSVKEAMGIVRRVDHPNLQCLVDSYHLWEESEPLENLRSAMPWIRHVHVADLVGRVAPGESGKADYKAFFKVLKAGGYDGLVSVEALSFDVAKSGSRVVEFVRKQWEEC